MRTGNSQAGCGGNPAIVTSGYWPKGPGDSFSKNTGTLWQGGHLEWEQQGLAPDSEDLCVLGCLTYSVNC